jgi:hypothetical protein
MHSRSYIKIILGLAVLLVTAGIFPASTQAQLISPTPTPYYGWQFTSPSPFISPWSQPEPGLSPNPGGGVELNNETVGVSTAQNQGGATVSLKGYCQGFNSGSLRQGGYKLADILKYVTCMIQRMIVPLLFSLGGLFFIMGMVKFITSSDSEERKEGKQFMIWGVIGFSVILSIWGILTILKDTIHIDNAAPVIPTEERIQ